MHLYRMQIQFGGKKLISGVSLVIRDQIDITQRSSCHLDRDKKFGDYVSFERKTNDGRE